MRSIISMCLAIMLAAMCGCGAGSSSETDSQKLEYASITVDGNGSDWDGMKPLVRDRAGDVSPGGEGGDIVTVFMARDEANLYARVDFHNSIPPANMYLSITFDSRGEGYAPISFIQVDNGNTCFVMNPSYDIITHGTAALSGSILELSVPVSVLDYSQENYVSIVTQAFNNDRYDYAAEDGIRLLLE